MKAALFDQTGKPLEITEAPDPSPSASGAVVNVLAVRVPSYSAKVFDGSLGYDLTPPLIPGPACIGQIEKVGDDVFDLEAGDIVLCNSLLSSADIVGSPDEILIGWTGSGTARSRKMQSYWKDGSFAQKAHYPARCLTKLPGAGAFDRALLPFLASLAIADGGLRRAGLQSGQSVLINGATGQLGGAAVLLSLAYGASSVLAAGRNESRLKTLAALGPRVQISAMLGDRQQDTQRIREQSGGGFDVVVDYLANTPTPDPTLTGFDLLNLKGTMVLVGGVRHPLVLPYEEIMRRQLTIKGSFMFEREDALKCWNLVRSGAIDLSVLNAHAYALDDIRAAMDKAQTLSGLDYVVLLPNG